MKFGIFIEHQVQRPWAEGDEARTFHESLAQVELADRIGIDHVWVVEHHFLEEYSHSSAPEIFLAACSQRTERIRLGHGIVLMPPKYNPPARVAERISTLDILSNGRVDFGTGVSASRTELEGFGIDPMQRFEMWREAVGAVTDMMAMTPYPGFEGKHFSMPCRNVIPKPMQKPHPPLWMACPKRDQVLFAAQNGLGALTFSFLDPSEAAAWVHGYYQAFDSCVPIGRRVNPNIAMVAPLMVHASEAEAEARARAGFEFFAFGLGYYYEFGSHQPGFSSVGDQYLQARAHYASQPCQAGIGSIDRVRKDLRGFEEAGVDQVAFLVHCGRTQHDHVMESLELFGREILPEFKEREAVREALKAERLADAIARAMSRKVLRRELTQDEVVAYPAYPRAAAERAAAAGPRESTYPTLGAAPAAPAAASPEPAPRPKAKARARKSAAAARGRRPR